MNSDKTIDLLNDLLRLLRKHEPMEFEHRASLLGDPAFMEKTSTMLRGIAEVSQKLPNRSKETNPAPLDPRHAELIDIARNRLSSNECYPHLRDVSDELAHLGMHVPSAGFKRREDAVRAAIRFLRSVAFDEAQQFVEKLRATTQRGSLQEWSPIIMERKR